MRLAFRGPQPLGSLQNARIVPPRPVPSDGRVSPRSIHGFEGHEELSSLPGRTLHADSPAMRIRR
jgi:hypothetical protein